MNLRKILIPVAASLLLLSTAAHARYVFVLPAAGSSSPSLQVYTETLQPMGAVSVPSGTSQVLTTVTGDKAIVIAQDPNAPVSFVTISNRQVVGAARPLLLDNHSATFAALTPDGKRLVVLGDFPATLYVIDPSTEKVVTGGIQLYGYSRNFVVTRDSKYAVVVCHPSFFFAVNLTTFQIEVSEPIPDVPELPTISLGPAGSIYVTARDRLVQFQGAPPFHEVARTTSTGLVWPGKLDFSADGRYGITTNETASGSSVLTYDFTVRGTNTSAGAIISQIPITFGDNVPKKMDLVTPISDTVALAYSSAGGRIFTFGYPVLSAPVLLSLGGVGVPQNVTGFALTNEFPTRRYLYYVTGDQIFRHDLVANAAQGSAAINAGPIVFSAQPSSAAPAVMYGYGAGQTVARNTPYTYYVRVLDANGRPVYDTEVSFTLEAGDVVLSNPSPRTNMDGYGYVTVTTSSSTSGEFRVRANCGTATVTLASSVSGGTGGDTGGGGTSPSAQVIKVSGDGQLLQYQFAAERKPLVVKVVDSKGLPLVGKQVTWTESGGIIFSGGVNITTTDANGLSEVEVVPSGNFPPGQPFLTYTIVANTDVGSASFTMTAYPLPSSGSFLPTPTVYLLKPTQEDKILNVKLGSKLDGVIETFVTSAGGLGTTTTAIPGVGLSVSTGNTDPKLGPVARCEGGTVLSGQDGVAKCNLIVEGLIGESSLTVDVGNFVKFPDLRVIVNAGDPIAPTILSGNNQTGKPGATLPQPLSIQVTDNYGNILPGLPVTWDVVTPNSVRLFNTISTTDYSGRSSTSVQLGSNPGKYKVRALVGGKEASFDITIETLATGFAKVSGDNQPVTPIKQQFPSPLVVVVTDAQGKPVSGASVSWTITGPGTLNAIASTTGADGRAQVNVTAGTTPGTITVTATVGSLPALTFTLQSRLPGPSITSTSFTNWATGEAVVSPGNLILITGPGLAPNIRGTVNANVLGGRLPFEMAGVTVEFQFASRSAYAPIYRVSNEGGVESVLIQAPFELTGTAVNAIVTVSGGNTTVTNIPLRSVSPGVIEDMISGRRAAVVIRSDGLVVSPETPARPGEEVRLYAIGLGQTTPAAETNRVGQPGQAVRATVAVGVDDKGVEVVRAELAENLIGVYEIVFKIPADAIIGNNRPLGFVIEETPGQPVYANGSVIAIGNTL